MDTAQLRRRKQEIIDRYGEWTAHNIHLAGNLYTIGNAKVQHRLRRIVQNVADVLQRPLKDLRVLDLGCLEGLYAVEFARHGATVVGIEARDANLEKARFAKQALGLENLEFVKDDVRNLRPEKYGTFDVVLCLGLLYHLDAPDVFEFVEQMFVACNHCLIIDTSFNLLDKQSFHYKERTYWGCAYMEHEEQASAEQKADALWSSIDNVKSVWLTKPSLLNLLAHVGFTSVFECHNPSEINKLSDRITLLAMKGQRRNLECVPAMNDSKPEDWPENRPIRVDDMQTRGYALSKRILSAIPREPKEQVKRVLRYLGLMAPAAQPWEWREPWKARQNGHNDHEHTVAQEPANRPH
jgi:2-polyprenyl-3-methyl-5-hydroxy-6-metoxy-1,4-benzoquinol methylase